MYAHLVTEKIPQALDMNESVFPVQLNRNTLVGQLDDLKFEDGTLVDSSSESYADLVECAMHRPRSGKPRWFKRTMYHLTALSLLQGVVAPATNHTDRSHDEQLLEYS